MADLTGIFPGGFDPSKQTPPPAPDAPPDIAFGEELLASGFRLIGPVVGDGTIRRIPMSDDKRGNKSGWYCLHMDHPAVGIAGNWRTGEELRWYAGGDRRDLSASERAAIDRRIAEAKATREREERTRQEAAAEISRCRVEESEPARADHPHLVQKKIPPCGARQQGENLLLAFRDSTGKITTCQTISPDGQKRFQLGGKKKGSWFQIGGEITGHVDIVEGFSTGATVHMATGGPIAVAGDAGNLKSVALAIRKKYPGAAIRFCADNDHRTEGNPGLRYAQEAAEAVGGLVAVPDVALLGEKETDFNDLMALHGIEAVREALETSEMKEPAGRFKLVPIGDLLKEPAPTKWAIHGWLPAESLAMLVGDPAAGKSFLALDWAARVATGTSTKNNRKSTVGPVIYLAGEGHHGIRRRLLAWSIHHDVDLGAAPLFVSEAGTALNDPMALTEVQAAIGRVVTTHGDPALIVVDTLHRSLVGDENSAKDIGDFVKACDNLKFRYKSTILVVHHSGHGDKTRGRGSSSLRGAVDVDLLLTTAPDGTRVLGCAKMKDGPIPDRQGFTIRTVPLPWLDEDGEPESSAVIVKTAMPGSAKERLSPSLELGLTTLREGLGEAGTVPLDVWRDIFYRDHPGDSLEAKRKAFLRVRKGLIHKGLITVKDDIYRLVPQRDRAGHSVAPK